MCMTWTLLQNNVCLKPAWKQIISMHKVCAIYATSLHKVCICRVDAHFFRKSFQVCRKSAHKVCTKSEFADILHTFNLHFRVCIKSAQKSALRVHIQNWCILYCIWSSVCNKSAWRKEWSDIKCTHSLHQVCIWKVCVEFAKSLHKVFICILKVCIKYAYLYHWLIPKCAWSAPYADFADLVHTHHDFGFLGWSVGQHMAHELM